MSDSAILHSEETFTPVHDPKLRLWFQSWKPAGVARAVVVIGHGLKDHSSRYSDFARELARRGFIVYAADLRGHGHSTGDRVWVESFDRYIADATQLVALVRAREPQLPIFLLGHSMGGTIATLYAIGHSGEVAGVVLSAPALKPDPGVSRVAIGFTKLISAIAPRAKLFRTENRLFSRDPKVVADMDADPLILQTPAPVRTAAELLRAMDRVRRTGGGLLVPLLALHGSDDRLTNPAGSAYLVEHAGSRDRQLKLYPELVHDLMHEPEHATVEADVLRWLDAHAPSDRSVPPPVASGGRA